MHDRRLGLVGQVRGQPVADPVVVGQLAGLPTGCGDGGLDALPLPGPPAQLPGQVAARPAEAGLDERLDVDPVHLGERGGQVEAERVPARLVEPAGQGVAHDDALDVLHQVERRADHVGVLADRDRSRHPHRRLGADQQVEHAVLADDVVRGRQQRTGRRAPQHPVLGRRLDDVRQVAVALAEPRDRDVGVRVEVLGQPAAEPAGSTSATSMAEGWAGTR